MYRSRTLRSLIKCSCPCYSNSWLLSPFTSSLETPLPTQPQVVPHSLPPRTHYHILHCFDHNLQGSSYLISAASLSPPPPVKCKLFPPPPVKCKLLRAGTWSLFDHDTPAYNKLSAQYRSTEQTQSMTWDLEHHVGWNSSYVPHIHQTL